MGNSQKSTDATLFHNANFITLDPDNTIAQGIVVIDSRINRVLTSTEEVELARKTIVTQIDLQGQTVIPGFIMSHTHLMTWSTLNNGISVSPMNLFFNPNYSPPTTAAEVLEVLTVEVPKQEASSVFSQGYDPVLQPGPVISRLDLDNVSKTQAIYLMSASMHNIYVNTQALINAGVVEAVGPDGTIILNDKVPADLKPEVAKGSLCEKAMMIIAASMPTVRVDAMMESLNTASRILNRKGITTVGDATVPDTIFPLYRDYSRMLPRVRIVGFPIYSIHSPWLTLAHGNFVRPNLTEYLTNDYFFVGPVKIIGDGAIEGYTAYLTQPYTTSPFFPVPDSEDWRGEPEFPKYEIQYAFETILRAGMRIAIHGNGDAIIDNILDAFEQAQTKYNVPDHRTRIEHCTTPRPDQIDRMQSLGMHPSFMSNHVYYYGDAIYSQILGPDRAERIDPMQDIVSRGMICDVHSDAPVTPPDPLFQIWIAVNRLTSGGRCLGRDQRVGVLDALKMSTINSAYTLGIDDRVGSLEVGKFADLVVLGQDILTVKKKTIKDIPITATYLGGKLLA